MKTPLISFLLLLGLLGAGCPDSSSSVKLDRGPRGDVGNPFPSYDQRIIGWTEAGEPIVAHDGSSTVQLKIGPYVQVTAGTFTMGSPETEPCRSTKEDQHKVTLTHDFEIAQHETTEEEFKELMGYDPSYNTECGTNCPVESMSWSEAAAYCNNISIKKILPPCYTCTGSGTDVQCEVDVAFTAAGSSIYDCRGYRLPTEAEWEYAYRAGTTDAFYNGPNDAALCSGLDPNADAIGWFIKNANGTKHPVEGKLANAWGLYDMAGNVAEFVNDSYQSALGHDDVTNPAGPPSSAAGIIRGGHTSSSASDIRAAYRQQQGRTSKAGTGVGFRCAFSK